METQISDNLFQIFRIIDSYIGNNDREGKILEYKEPEEIAKIMDVRIGEEGEGIESLCSRVENYLKHSVKTGKHLFFNQLYSGFNYPAFIGDMVTSLSNTSMYTFEVAPVATVLEMELVRKMNEYTKYRDGDGIFVSGGSNANLLAMFTARNQADSGAKKDGLYDRTPLKAYVSNQSHYSFFTAVNLLGIGTANLTKIKTDGDGRMISSDLENQIHQSLDNGEKPFFVSATAGTTLLGAFDPIDELAGICEKYGLWLHVDGSFGGSIILSKKHREFFSGIERSDSFTWNPHKLMNIPLICSALLLRNKDLLKKNIIDCETNYIFHESETSDFDLGKKSIQCGRRVDSLKLWLAWKYFGDKGYESKINRLFEICRYFETRVSSTMGFELLAPVQSLTVCFRYLPPSKIDINSFNMNLRERLRKNGDTTINYGFIGKTLALRFVAVNPEVTDTDIDRFFSFLMKEIKIMSNH